MRSLITDHRIEHSRPRQDNSTEYCEKVSHTPHSTLSPPGCSNGPHLLTRPSPRARFADSARRAKTRMTQKTTGSRLRLQRFFTRCPTGSSSKAAGSPPTEAYPCGTSQGDGRLRTMLVTLFGIWLKKPLSAKEERSRHPGMRHTESDTAFALIDEILLIQRIHNIETYHELLPVPGQRNDMANRKVIDRVGRAMTRVGLGTFFCRPQP